MKSLFSHAKTSLLCACLAIVGCSTQAGSQQVSVHDPVMIKSNDTYYVFSTGPGITYYQSDDMIHWQLAGRVFATEPKWAKSVAPSFDGHLWAPDVIEKDGVFYLYYSVSAFGRNTSAIGVATTKSLDPNSADFGWVDHGAVIESVPERDDWNAIDPALIADEHGNYWMSFGSFWSGLKLVKMDPSLTAIAQPQEWHHIARRPLHEHNPSGGAIEAPFIFKHQGFYYQFLSFDKCCRGMDSDYKIMVGRSKTVTGPYLDKQGNSLLDGGGTLVLQGNKDYVALGHNSAYHFDGQDYLVFHAYETADNAQQKLKILPIKWVDGWPTVNPDDLNRYQSVLMK
ncbi:arabinan endo-1,5-alpha-L-arabinosidase [Neiella sp. HB171785]|uniref:Extracellular exo-alpha-(1->5)-L-arabinofuranosidase n=1 Tax=Neiella litorisoli TaxID=2771431 RepID=A0A8J6UE15_9GAMM|nr:arabinan endo-1,5-alpha-L-arabinosidase [Neiella litorisoli]MBD1389039.1 arabinan endo-1,5-alpha-L-arabinosidase [Neiella litorisoli]